MMSKYLKILIAVLLLVCLIIPIMTACSGGSKKEAGYEFLDAKNEKLIIIKTTAGEGESVKVVVRKIEQDKETKVYGIVKEYTPKNENNCFAVNVQEEGIYEVEASCEGMETAKYTVIVDEDRIYDLFFALDPVETEATEAE